VGVRLDIQGGMNTVSSPDQLSAGWPYLQNVRRYLNSRTIARAPLTDNQLDGTLPNGITSLTRLNDSTPLGPVSGFALIEGTSIGDLYVNTTKVVTGLDQIPCGFLIFRPNATPQPWCYVANPALTAQILNPNYPFLTSGMVKVRSDGTTWKQGIKEPQVAPTVTFPGGGSGTTQIFYRYVYRNAVCGNPSNPSPESIAGTNAQASPSANQVAATAGVINANVTVNATQYEGNGAQIRTKGISSGVLTDYIVCRFPSGFTLPDNVTIDGIQIDLNWEGQNAGTGVLSQASLFYLGAPIGNPEFPSVANQSFATDTLLGGNSDKWGASLTSAIINDPSFGFGVRILTQSVGGTNRSFINYFTITVYYSTQDANLTPTASTDPQVNKIDWYRQGGLLVEFTYVGTSPNTATVFNDTLSDFAALNNPLLEFDNYEPFPSIDLPRTGVVNVAAGSVAGTMQVTRVSGDNFNVRWLPGTDTIIGGVAYTLYNRPTSTSAMTVVLETGQVVPSPATGLTYEIPEPLLAAEPSPVEWGPTPDNAGAFAFALDPNNPGDLLWTKGNNFDSAPDTNRQNVTSPNEPLMNGTVTAELSTVFSTDRFWLIYPNFADALSDVTGTSGQQWTLIQSQSTRGLFMRYALGALGSLNAFRAKDGIFISQGGGPEQDISANIGNLFPRGGQEPATVHIGEESVFPPDDSKPNAQTISIIPGYIFYNYQDKLGTQRTLVYDMEAKGWSVDDYSPRVNCHALAIGQVNEVLCGCADGTVRIIDASTGTESGVAVIATRSENAGSTRTIKRIGGIWLRAIAASAVALAFWADRFQVAISGFSPTTAGTGSDEEDYLIDLTGATNADVQDIGCTLTWPLGSGNVLSEWDIDSTMLPQPVIGYKTGLMTYGAKGWMHIPWMNLAYKSTSTVNVTLTLDNGGPISLTFPSTSGVQQKTFQTLPPNKFKIVGWTINSSQPFTIFADQSEILLSVWGVQSANTVPFSGFGIPGATS
jgi:hypothetical protein